MVCVAPAPSLDICPSKAEIVPQLLALLPRGRAWGTHDGGPFPGSVPYRFWTAIASIFEFANARICALRREFFCATQSETRDVWLADYGLPDGCDPYPDLCLKVAAIGGTRCDYYEALALAAGWSIHCVDPCGSLPRTRPAGTILPPAVPAAPPRASRAGRLKAGRPLACLPPLNRLGCFVPGTRRPAVIRIRIATAASPSFQPNRQPPSKSGCLKAGRALACGPDIGGLVCLLERVVHAENLIIYEVV